MHKAIVVKEYIDYFLEKNELTNETFCEKYNFNIELLSEILDRNYENVWVLTVFRLAHIIKVPMHKLVVCLDPEAADEFEEKYKNMDDIFEMKN